MGLPLLASLATSWLTELALLVSLAAGRYAAGSLFAHTCARWRGLGTAAIAVFAFPFVPQAQASAAPHR